MAEQIYHGGMDCYSVWFDYKICAGVCWYWWIIALEGGSVVALVAWFLDLDDTTHDEGD